MKNLFLTLLLFLLFPAANAQIIIPIIIPTYTYDYFECKTTDSKALEYFNLGKENMGTNLNISLAYFKGAIKEDSLFCDAYDYTARVFMKKENNDSALKYIDLSLGVNASNQWAGDMKIHLLFLLKEYEKAGDYAYSRHLKESDEGIWLYYLAESLFERDLLDSAKNITLKMQMVMQKQGNELASVHSMYLQGKIFCKMKEYMIAQRALKKVKSNYRGNAEFNYYLGLTYLYGENPNQKKARKYIKKAFNKDMDIPREIISELEL